LFGFNRTMRGQLDDKYRKMTGELNLALETVTGRLEAGLEHRTADSCLIFQQLKNTFSDRAALFESELLPDLIHMSLNRAFRTRHRMQELVVYDFLSRYYESVRARTKSRET
jgi:hypothetical protein